ncbi:putative MHC class I antigen protein [Naja naja]|nr:putative MHC class I antigen protein [Naja naja]
MASTPGRSMPPGRGMGRSGWRRPSMGLWPQRMGPTTTGSASGSTPKRGAAISATWSMTACRSLWTWPWKCLRLVQLQGPDHRTDFRETSRLLQSSSNQAVLGSGVLKEKLLGQGNPEEDEKIQLVEGPSD